MSKLAGYYGRIKYYLMAIEDSTEENFNILQDTCEYHKEFSNYMNLIAIENGSTNGFKKRKDYVNMDR